MEKMVRVGWLILAFLAFLTFEVSAGNPGNGFPSGPHYNLNIIGKKSGFQCPDLEVNPETGAPIYGNVVFVPERGEGIHIYMQSGKGSKAAAITELQAIDLCAGFDGNGAAIQLPKNDAGYRVYARALAKPTNNPNITVYPSLVAAEDEFGNDLIYLGLVTNQGFVKSDGETFSRPKGSSRAMDISGLFMWSGAVCYFTPPSGTYQPYQVCCTDTDLNGVYEDCQVATVVNGVVSCPPSYSLVQTYCMVYEDPVWVFNIADFVTYLWSLNNDGVKLLQVRFYPN